MTIFMLIMIIALTVSNVLLWIICKELLIMLIKLADNVIELCDCISK